jgi:ribonuclease Z
LKFTILGTGSATPITERRPSAALLDLGNESVLLDCGEGTQFQMLKYKVRFSRLKYILITHLHGDHFFGLIALLNTLNNTGRTEPLVLIGPHGLQDIISVQLKYSLSFLNYTVNYRTTNPGSFDEVFSNEKISISTIPLKHRIPCTGYLISEKPALRKILAERLPSDFPLPYFKMLKEGFDVEHEGKIYANAEYTVAPASPKKVAYCSDTIFDPEIARFVNQADLLYHESTFTKELSARAQMTFHSTAEQAASIAKAGQVKQLIIGHFSSRYKDTSTFLTEAREIFPNTYLSEEGKTFHV